ncbi:MAG: hypothetical protein RBT75_19770 [Anaerolineae bacterium]|jgi:hypothetical protein|nr:hypothetical protein [Anaerolineae bacterium]
MFLLNLVERYHEEVPLRTRIRELALMIAMLAALLAVAVLLVFWMGLA